jgi:hypothetical protein
MDVMRINDEWCHRRTSKGVWSWPPDAEVKFSRCESDGGYQSPDTEESAL